MDVQLNRPKGVNEVYCGDVFQHKNGGLYEIVCTARNSNDCKQELVVYKSLQESDFPLGTIWVRTMTEFNTLGRFVLFRAASNNVINPTSKIKE